MSSRTIGSSLLLVSAGVVAGALLVVLGGAAVLQPPRDYPGAAYGEKDGSKLLAECRKAKVKKEKHYDALPGLALKRAPNGFDSLHTVTVTAFDGLEALDDPHFDGTLRPIAYIKVADRNGGGTTRTLCLLSGRQKGSTPADVGKWSAVYVDSATAVGIDGRFASYEANGAAPARLAFLRTNAQARPAARLLYGGSGLNPSLGEHTGNAPLLSARASQAWYRCGTGCCGAALDEIM